MLRNDERYLNNISTHLKNLKKKIKKLQKYQYDMDYSFNEHNEEDYTSKNDINAFKDARSFLMNVEVTFFVKKQTELEKNSMKRKQSIFFLEKDSLTNKQRKVLIGILRILTGILRILVCILRI